MGLGKLLKKGAKLGAKVAAGAIGAAARAAKPATPLSKVADTFYGSKKKKR